MNKSNAHLYLPLVQALAEGKTIQYAENPNREGSWSDSGEVHLGHPPDRYRIKPLPFPPIPDGMTYHNPDGLTAEQVGDGYRLCVVGELQQEGYEYWRPSTEKWARGDSFNVVASVLNNNASVRVHIQTPFPDGSRIVDGQLVKPWSLTRHIPGFRPLREDESWHRTDWTEEMLAGGWRPLLKGEHLRQEDEVKANRINSRWGNPVSLPWLAGLDAGDTNHGDSKAIFFTRTRRPLPEPPKRVPLGPSDVPPGSAIRQNAKDPGWAQVTTVGYDGLELVGLHGPKFYSFEKLMDGGYQILRPGKTDWQSCSKTA